MNLEQVNLHLNAYKESDQILDAAKYLIRNFDLEHENFAGFGFREELKNDGLLLTAEGEIGEKQIVKIPRNLFDFDIKLVLNMVAHEMLHVRQKDPNSLVEDKNEREFQAYYEMLFHKVFPQIPELSPLYQTIWRKSFRILQKNGEGSEFKKICRTEKEVEDLIAQP
jgi:hypothetical protein